MESPPVPSPTRLLDPVGFPPPMRPPGSFSSILNAHARSAEACGPTQTMPPLPGSPAIGAGANFVVDDAHGTDLTTVDQREVATPAWGR